PPSARHSLPTRRSSDLAARPPHHVWTRPGIAASENVSTAISRSGALAYTTGRACGRHISEPDHHCPYHAAAFLQPTGGKTGAGRFRKTKATQLFQRLAN